MALLCHNELVVTTDFSQKAYRQTFNIRRTCIGYKIVDHSDVGNKIVDQSDVVGASPVGAAPTTSSFST